MSSISAKQAAEIDSKLQAVRRRVTDFACGFIHQDDTKTIPAKEHIAASCKTLIDIESHCNEFVQSTNELGQLLQEADGVADEIFARLCEHFADCGLDVPTIDEEEIPVGIPLERLTLKEADSIQESSPDVSEEEKTPNSSSNNSDDQLEFKPNIFIHRSANSDGLVTCTPMIKAVKSRKRLL